MYGALQIEPPRNAAAMRRPRRGSGDGSGTPDSETSPHRGSSATSVPQEVRDTRDCTRAEHRKVAASGERSVARSRGPVSHDAPGTPSGARDGDVPPILGISFSGFEWMWSTARNGDSVVAPVCLVVMALAGDQCKPGLPCQVPTDLIFPRIRMSGGLPRFP